MLRNDKDDVDRFCGANVIRSESAVDLTSAITDFYKFGDKEIFELIQTRGEKDLPDEIILHTYNKNFSVKVDCFVKHSVKIRELVDRKNLPRIVNLTTFNVSSVKIFVKYIHCGQLTGFRLVSHRVLDLLQIARIFHVYGLIDAVAKYLVSTIGPKFDTVLMLNLLVITSDWSMTLNENLRSTIYTVAANNFIQLWNSANFPKIPFSILILLFNRCDLNVKDEFEVATLILQWLEFTKRSDSQCLALTRIIRSGLLTQKQKKEIIVRLSISAKSGKNFSKIFEKVLHSPRSQRCCVIEDHINVGYKRCGIPSWNEDLRSIEKIKINVSQKIQEEKEITFIDKSRPPCIHKNDELLSDESSEYMMQFWADYWRDNNVSCKCACHQIKQKKKEQLSLLTPKKKSEKSSPRKQQSSPAKKKRGSSRRKSKKSVESSKSDSVLLSGKFPHFHAPKPEKDSP
uniref:BACK domain-containing protein n=1 Tax=Panagrolaimus superbus TaxID=310955 RepID=A0A914YWR2_9BILA